MTGRLRRPSTRYYVDMVCGLHRSSRCESTSQRLIGHGTTASVRASWSIRTAGCTRRHSSSTWESSRRKKKPRKSEAFIEAGDGIRTRDPQLGKLMLYQLSYTRKYLQSGYFKRLRTSFR